jgi:uncharacterized membrane protein
MRWWLFFVLLTVASWGAYVPTVHHGQAALGKNSALRAFLFIGLAYAIAAVAVLIMIKVGGKEPWSFTGSGVRLSFVGGLLGAIGALGIVFALKNGGSPLVVPPLVFAGAPIIATLVNMAWDRVSAKPQPLFYVGLAMAALGAGLVLRYKPAAAPHAPAPPTAGTPTHASSH